MPHGNHNPQDLADRESKQEGFGQRSRATALSCSTTPGQGLEGIVSKREGGLYSSGRCRDWLKVKNTEFQRR